MHRTIKARTGMTFKELMEDELDTAGQHQMDLDANGMDETTRDRVIRARKQYAFANADGKTAEDFKKLPDWLKTASGRKAELRKRGLGAPGSANSNLEISLAELELAIEAAGGLDKLKESGEIDRLAANLGQDSEIQAAVRKDTSDTWDTALLVVGGIVVTAVTAGTGSAIYASVATASVEAIRMTVKEATLGHAYGGAEFGADLLKAAAAVGTAGLLAKEGLFTATATKVFGSGPVQLAVGEQIMKSATSQVLSNLADPAKYEDLAASGIDALFGMAGDVLLAPFKVKFAASLVSTGSSAATAKLIASAVVGSVGGPIAETVKAIPAIYRAKGTDERQAIGNKVAIGALGRVAKAAAGAGGARYKTGKAAEAEGKLKKERVAQQ